MGATMEKTLMEDHKEIARGTADGVTYTVYQSTRDARTFALHRAGSGEAATWCHSLRELLAALRASVPAPALAEIAGTLIVLMLSGKAS